MQHPASFESDFVPPSVATSVTAPCPASLASSASPPPKKRLAFHEPHALLGPLRPVRGAHTVAEAGGSVWLPTPALLLFRLFSTCGLVFSFVLFSATGAFAPHTLGAWVFALAMLAMAAATISSLCYLIAPERSAIVSARGPYGLLSDVVVPLLQTALAAAVTLSIVYWPLLRGGSTNTSVAEVLQYAVAALVLALDVGVAFRMSFRLAYVVVAPLVFVVWLVFAWARFAAVKTWPYPGLDFRRMSVARTVMFHLAAVLGTSAIGLLVLIFNRLNRLPSVSARIRRKVADEEIASTASVDAESAAERGLDAVLCKSEMSSVRSSSSPLPMPDFEADKRRTALHTLFS